ncbi:protein spindle-F [Sitodiplosis mosellana]|uniref:protein spindle-F n=1 Tax=Sitodiplosis mosellana TaxID=263140 RepID=UPI002443E598|nr:protein spindle-F [Sitodiplosis mosellana]XP_055321629.1 protein spindle-F [Sitodiplosis mosellana]
MDSNKSDTVQTKEQLASHYALHVALQTMKERCLALQQRLTTVEQENSTLRKQCGQDQPNLRGNNMDDRSEIEVLREQVGELTRQKYQLTEHIGMVAMENRQLWLRLSKLTKDNQSLGVSLNKIKTTLTETTAGHQNLIRSKTFTQNSPNPILRQKMQMQDGTSTHDNGKEMEDVSLEEISLKDYTDQPNVQGDPNAPHTNTEFQSRVVANSMGFGYLNDESINTILSNDTKKCMDSMVDIKKELLRQQSDLKVALSGLRQRRVLELCLNCKNQSMKKANTADKNLGTDEVQEFYQEHIDGPATFRRRQSSENDAEITEIIGDNAAFIPIKPDNQSDAVDITQQKKIADCMDKMCPMCGKVYSNVSSFELFQDHVESHFIDDTDLDLSVEKNFEFVSNTVGQF